LDEISLAVIVGAIPLTLLLQLPDGYIYLSIIMGVLGCVFLRCKPLYVIALILMSFIWSTGNGQYLLSQTSQLSRGEQEIVAQVNTLNLGRTDKHQIVMKITQANGQPVFPSVFFRTEWSNTDKDYCAGQEWRLKVKLRPVHASLNEGGFDSQRWALANHWPLSGRISHGVLVQGECNLRQKFISHVLTSLKGLENNAVVIALAFGEKGLINAEDKLMMQRTGIAHLVAISGLHIGIAAWFGWLLARGLQCFLPLKFIDYRFPLILSEIAMLAYTWLAGGNAPAMRAAIALSLWIALRFYRIKCHPWQIWLWCVALLLLLDPLNILSDSFLLSCFAVATLIFWFQWAPLPKKFGHAWHWAILRWAHLQLGMTLLLLPMQIGLFQGINILSFAANIWAVPVVSLSIVPLILIGLLTNDILSHVINGWIWSIADQSLSIALWGARLCEGHWYYLAASTVALTFIGWGSIIAWRFGWLTLYPVTALILFSVQIMWVDKHDPENWRVDMVDVGHGLAMLISKNGKGILYDTGDRWDTGSAAEMDILPLVRWRNIQIEQIIISHADSDHRGGLVAMRQAFPQASLRESSVDSLLPCHAGVKWRWQGLAFSALWPEKPSAVPRNNDSCVIRVDDGKFSFLLTGDIEAEAERKMVAIYRESLKSTVLQVPHHGSNTSSTGPFLRTVAPILSLASSSRFNKWHLPAKKVVTRYLSAKLDWRDTAHSGQLAVRFYDDYWSINGLREQIFPRWYHQRFGVLGDNE